MFKAEAWASRLLLLTKDAIASQFGGADLKGVGAFEDQMHGLTRGAGWAGGTKTFDDPVAAAATPGDHTIVSRATDEDGRVQPSAEDPVMKKKATYWEANQQWVRKIRVA